MVSHVNGNLTAQQLFKLTAKKTSKLGVIAPLLRAIRESQQKLRYNVLRYTVGLRTSGQEIYLVFVGSIDYIIDEQRTEYNPLVSVTPVE